MNLPSWVREHIVDWDPRESEQVSTWDRNDAVGVEVKDGAK